MTLAHLRAMVRGLITYDLEGVRATDADLNDLINRAYFMQCETEVANLSRQPEERTYNVAANQRTVSLPGIIRMDGVAWLVSGQPVELEPLPIDQRPRLFRPDTGTPRYFRRDGENLWIYPVPASAGTLVVVGVYKIQPVPLTQDNHQPLTPASIHPGIAYRAAAEWALRFGSPKAQALMEAAMLAEQQLDRNKFADMLHSWNGIPR